MRFQTRLIAKQTFEDGASFESYEILDGTRPIGTKTVHYPAKGSIEFTYRLEDQTFRTAESFITAYLNAQDAAAA